MLLFKITVFNETFNGIRPHGIARFIPKKKTNGIRPPTIRISMHKIFKLRLLAITAADHCTAKTISYTPRFAFKFPGDVP